MQKPSFTYLVSAAPEDQVAHSLNVESLLREFKEMAVVRAAGV